jgi:RimJ/RimL family protein N-acetyltransferase
MERAPIPSLTDGVIQIRPLTQADVAAHLAGEDEEMAKWLSGGRSTAATVQTAIDKFEEQWGTGGPRRAFGVFDCSNDQLIGFVEANLELLGNPAEVNVSYGIFPPWRGRRLAGRAIDLVAEYLRSATEARDRLADRAGERSLDPRRRKSRLRPSRGARSCGRSAGPVRA